MLCLYPFSWSVSVIFCIMCVHYILHAHLLIMNEILEMFTWKTNLLSLFPLFCIPVSQLSHVFYFFYIWDPCIYISLYILWKPAIKTIIIIIIIIIIITRWLELFNKNYPCLRIPVFFGFSLVVYFVKMYIWVVSSLENHSASRQPEWRCHVTKLFNDITMK